MVTTNKISRIFFLADLIGRGPLAKILSYKMSTRTIISGGGNSMYYLNKSQSGDTHVAILTFFIGSLARDTSSALSLREPTLFGETSHRVKGLSKPGIDKSCLPLQACSR